MSRELSLSASLGFSKNGAKFDATSAGLLSSGSVDVAGDNAIKENQFIDRTGLTLDKGAIGVIGFALLKNLATAGVPDAPVVTVTIAGAAGTTSRTYVVVANFADGSKSVSNAFAIATTNATLDGTNYDIVAWTDVGAATYDIYRTVSGGTPSTTGLIHSGSTTSPYNDQGAAGDSASVPAAIASIKAFEIGADGTNWPLQLKAGESNLFRWNATDMHVRAAGPPVPIEDTLIED